MADQLRRAATYVPKGGVGKTTSAAHIGVAAHREHDLDVILIDLAGTQNDLANQFGLDIDDGVIDAPISAVFGDNWDQIVTVADDILSRMTFETGEGPDLIPADSGLGGADNNLANVPLESRFHRLDDFVRDILAPEYDLVMFDLPGTENNIALNGLFAAGNVVAPLKPGEFELDQLGSLEADLMRIRDETSHDVAPTLRMVVPTIIDRQTKLSNEFVNELADTYEDRVGPEVAKSQDIPNQQRSGRTIYAVEESELYDTAVRARKAYSDATTDLLEIIEPR